MPAVADLPTTAAFDVESESAPGDAALLGHRTRSLAIRTALARPGAYLALDGRDSTLLIPLKHGVTHVGRGLSADVRLDEQHVSRRHAVVIRDGDRVILLDDRSAAGTRVNGRNVERAELRDNDTIELGPVTLRYVEVVHEPHREVDGERTRRSQRAMDGWVSTRMRTRSRARARSRLAAPQPSKG